MYTDILSFEEAAKRSSLGIDATKLPDLSALPAKISSGMLALLKLQVIVHAVNNDVEGEPEVEFDFNDREQDKWYPDFWGGDKTGSGFRFYGTDYDWTLTSAYGGARLALKDEERADFMGRNFADLYKDLYLILG